MYVWDTTTSGLDGESSEFGAMPRSHHVTKTQTFNNYILHVVEMTLTDFENQDKFNFQTNMSAFLLGVAKRDKRRLCASGNDTRVPIFIGLGLIKG